VSRSPREVVSASYAATLADALADTVRRRSDRRQLRALAERWRDGPHEVEIAERQEEGDGDGWEQAIAMVARDPELAERWLEGRYQIAAMRGQLSSATAYPLLLGLVAMIAFCLLGLSLQRLDRAIAEGIDDPLLMGVGKLGSSTSGLMLTVAPSVGLLVLLGLSPAGRQPVGRLPICRLSGGSFVRPERWSCFARRPSCKRLDGIYPRRWRQDPSFAMHPLLLGWGNR
jgi:hypothetical protein